MLIQLKVKIIVDHECIIGDSLFSDCVDGDIQLIGGATRLEGRVEVCINHAWGGICDNSWGSTDASVACSQLGFQRAGEYITHNVAVVTHTTVITTLECMSYLTSDHLNIFNFFD